MRLTLAKYSLSFSKTLSFILAISISLSTWSQAREDDYLGTPNNKSRNNIIGLSLGGAFPMGAFSETNANDSESGYALSGAGIEIQYAYLIQENLAISLLWGSNSYPVDELAYIDAVRSFNPPGTYSLTVDDYVEGHFFIGLKLFGKNNPNWFINPFFGTMNLTVPKLTLNQAIDGRPDLTGTISTNESNNRSFGFGLAIGGEYFITDKFGINLTGQYMRASFDVESLGFASFENGTSIAFINSYDQPYELIAIKLGGLFRF